MPNRAHLFFAMSATVILAAIACGGEKAAEPTVAPTEVQVAPIVVKATQVTEPAATSEPVSATPTVVAGATQVTEPAATTEPVSTTTAPPTAVSRLNGATPTGGLVAVAAGDDLTTVEVVKILTPSVVQIVTEAVGMGMFNEPIPGGGVGTGVVLDDQGHVLTNNHVIAGAQTIVVTLSNGESFPANVIGADPSTDTAVIRIRASGLQPAELGSSSDLQIGEDVIAIGHALGLEGGPTVSKGVVSALGRSIGVDPVTTIVDLIQTDAAINPGNSGGALVNDQAQVVGINTAIIPGSQGIGFAINIDDVKVVVAQLMVAGTVERGFLGINPFNMNPGLARQLGVPVVDGIAVAGVGVGTGAHAAGLQEGDVIVQLGNDPIRNTGEMSKFLLSHLPGETVYLAYFRLGVRIETEITLGTRPPR